MCGRTRCTLNATQVARACGLRDGDADSVRTVEMDRFRPSYNVSPGAYVPVFRAGSNGHGPEVGVSCHAVHCMKWGLVPSFTKKTEKPDHYRMFNARSESIKEKASFRRLIPNNRCLVAVEGFYEWKKDGSKKQPYYIHFRDERPLVFAALYDCWENSEGEMLYTFTVLTTRCAPALEWLHDRMPVIVGNNDNIQMWLSKSPVNLETILAPYSDPDLVWYPVTSAMGKPSFEGPECIKEIPLKPAVQNQISNLFSKKADGISKCKPEPDTLKEDRPATEEAAGESPEGKHQLDAISSAETKIVARESHSLKRGFMGTGTDTEIKPDKPNNHSATMSKKKLQTGDKQVSLFSYFGKK